jgi:hypothetical protein
LYNPNPADPESTKKYIAGPLAAILTLGLPRSDNGRTYNWPFFHKIRSTGIYNLDPAIITNIAVIKGGDQQQIAYNQHLAIVDVRIDFSSLYNSILIEEGGQTMTNRPTLRSYLDALTKNDKAYTRRGGLRQVMANRVGAPAYQGFTRRTSDREQRLIARDEAAARRQNPRVQTVTSGSRVSSVSLAKQTQLEEESPV